MLSDELLFFTKIDKIVAGYMYNKYIST